MTRTYTPNHLTESQRRIASDYVEYLVHSRDNPFQSSRREGWIAVSTEQQASAAAAGAKTASQMLDHVVYGDYLPIGERERIRKALGFR